MSTAWSHLMDVCMWERDRQTDRQADRQTDRETTWLDIKSKCFTTLYHNEEEQCLQFCVYKGSIQWPITILCQPASAFLFLAHSASADMMLSIPCPFCVRQQVVCYLPTWCQLFLSTTCVFLLIVWTVSDKLLLSLSLSIQCQTSWVFLLSVRNTLLSTSIVHSI